MNVLDPSTTHPPPTRRARVRTAATSEPASGSVMASAPIASPRSAGTSQRRFCASLPKRQIGGVAIPVCAPIPAASPPEPQRASSSANTASATWPSPPPPHWRSYFRPSQPAAASCPKTASGNAPAASHAAACGRSSASIHARARARNASCSAVNGGQLEAVAAPDDVEHDLVGPGADPVEPHVAPRALDPVLAHVARPAVDLQALVGHLAGDARGVELGHRDLAHGVLAAGEAPGGRVDELARGLDLRRHVGELVPDDLELADAAPERLALGRVAHRLVERVLRPRHAARRADQPLPL